MTGRARVSMRDVAALAGVSMGTVSNTLNRPDAVAEPTRARVHAAIAQLGWVRNEPARQLRAGRSRFLGAVVIDVANPYFTDVVRGAEEAAARAGYSILLANSGLRPEREEMHLELFKQQRVRGVLLAPILDVQEKVHNLRRFGIPVVLMDRSGDMRDLCGVSVDEVEGGRLAVGHLVTGGHRKVAFVGGPISRPRVQDRRRGAERACEEQGLGAGALRVIATERLDVAAGRWAGEQMLALSPDERPTGVFAANDLVSIGLLQALLAAGCRVPEDLAIVGYDDIDFAATSAVPLSSVRQPRADIGRRAAEMLLEEIVAQEEGRPHRHHQSLFVPELVVRASSG